MKDLSKFGDAQIISGTMNHYSIYNVEELKELFWIVEPEEFEFIRLECHLDKSNKFYEMKKMSNKKFSVRYGKIGSVGLTKTYDINQWDKKYNEKINKGYQ